MLSDKIKKQLKKIPCLKYNLPVEYSKLNQSERRLVREQYISEQNGLCMFCKISLKESPPKEITDKKILWSMFPENFLNSPVHLQHDHVTDLTEGAVHNICNAVLWQYHGR